MQELLLDLSLVGLVLVATQQSADRQGNLLLLLVDSGDLGIHHLALGQNITGLLNAAVGDLGNVDQTIHTGNYLRARALEAG